jgi:Glycosyl hydrolase family 79 C-terminal beta domain
VKRWWLGLLAVLVLAAGLAIGVLGTRDGSDVTSVSAPDPLAVTTVSAKTAPVLDPLPPSVTIALPAHATGRTVPEGFLGLSFEFQAVRAYTGSDPRAINPVLEQLIRNLSPGQAPVLRVGGDSTDASYAPSPGLNPPSFLSYALTPSWLETTGALARDLGARLIMGLNLVANQPALAAAEAQDYIQYFGRSAIEAFEIGNEPNIYKQITVTRPLLGLPLRARPETFQYPDFRRQFQAVARALPSLPLAGPALAVGPKPIKGSWIKTMPEFLRHDPRVGIMTVHRYPLRNCYVPPSSPQYPTVPHLVSPYSTVTLAASLKRWIAIAHGQHRQLRVDELNSVACRGKTGISDTFASSLWSLDAVFSLLAGGVDGVNVHTLPDAAYQLFQFSQQGGRWRGWVRPVYYGLQLFAQAAPRGSRLFRLPRVARSAVLSTWATRALDGTIRVVLIDKDPAHGETVTLRPPRSSSRTATIERLQAPSVYSTSGVTLGGRSYGSETYTGTLGPPVTAPLTRGAGGGYRLRVPAGSAALVTFPSRR